MFFDSAEVAWSDLSVFLNGKLITKLTGIKYKVSVSKEAIHAAGDEPTDINSGLRDYTGELKILVGGLDQINAAAVAAGYRDCLDMKGLVIVNNYKPAINRAMLNDSLIGVEFTEFEKDFKSGDKKMEVTIPFLFLRKK